MPTICSKNNQTTWQRTARCAVLTLFAAAFFATPLHGQAPTSTPATPATAPAEPLAYPGGMSMPWRIVGVDALTRAAARDALTRSLTTMRTAWLDDPQTFTAFLANRKPLTINRKRLTDQIGTGTPRTPLPSPAVTVEPTWCSFMDRHVFVVTVADTALNTLLGSAHVTIPIDRWEALGQGRAAFLSAQLPALTTRALAQATTKGAAPASDALHVGLSLARSLTRDDEGFSACIGLLVEEKLAPDYTVARALGTDHLATVRDTLGQRAALRRPTRGLVMAWSNPPERTLVNKATGPGPTRRLPVTLELKANMAETVFGGHVPVTHASRWTFAANGDQIGFTVDAGFKKLLDDERATLQLADWPQVARINRAWVYLDRGRAWGLKMNDRVVAEVDGEPVKGHVVRFFGPEAGLTSPRGFPIREGAIVYVRKNQRKARLGLEFRMDPREYPTPYPMTPSSK